VQDRRRQLWANVITRHWNSLDELNAWLLGGIQRKEEPMALAIEK